MGESAEVGSRGGNRKGLPRLRHVHRHCWQSEKGGGRRCIMFYTMMAMRWSCPRTNMFWYASCSRPLAPTKARALPKLNSIKSSMAMTVAASTATQTIGVPERRSAKPWSWSVRNKWRVEGNIDKDLEETIEARSLTRQNSFGQRWRRIVWGQKYLDKCHFDEPKRGTAEHYFDWNGKTNESDNEKTFQDESLEVYLLLLMSLSYFNFIISFLCNIAFL